MADWKYNLCKTLKYNIPETALNINDSAAVIAKNLYIAFDAIIRLGSAFYASGDLG